MLAATAFLVLLHLLTTNIYKSNYLPIKLELMKGVLLPCLKNKVMIRSSKLVFLTTGSPNNIRASLRYQPVTKRLAPHQRSDDFKRGVLEGVFMMNQNPNFDDRWRIAERIGVMENRVAVRYQYVYTSYFKTFKSLHDNAQLI